VPGGSVQEVRQDLFDARNIDGDGNAAWTANSDPLGIGRTFTKAITRSTPSRSQPSKWIATDRPVCCSPSLGPNVCVTPRHHASSVCPAAF
jgi:hypothetical protein